MSSVETDKIQVVHSRICKHLRSSRINSEESIPGLLKSKWDLCLNFETVYGGQEPSRNRVLVPVFLDPLRSPEIDSQLADRYDNPICCIPARQATKASGIDSSESIPGLHKRLQIRAQAT
jgi:hypothetical protein